MKTEIFCTDFMCLMIAQVTELGMRKLLHCKEVIYRSVQRPFDRALYDMLAKNVEDTLSCYTFNLL